MSTISTLTVRLTANSADLQKSLQKATRSVKKFGQSARQFANVAGKAMAAAAAAAGTALAAMVAKSAKAGDELLKTSQKLGLASEALVGFRHAAEQTGVGADKADMALQRMTRRIAEAAQGTGEAQGAIEALGLDAAKLAAMSPDKAFAEISEAMKGVSSQGEKVRLAFKFFDSEGVDLVNTLALGKEGLQAMQTEAEQLGITLNEFEAQKFVDMNDSIDRGKKLFEGFSNQLSVQMAPIVTDLVNRFTAWVKEMGGMGSVAQRVFNFLISGAGHVANAVRGLKVVWLGIKTVVIGFGAAVAEVFRTLVNNYMIDFGNNVRTLLLTPLRTVVNALSPFSETARKAGAALDTLMNVGRVEWIDNMADGFQNKLQTSVQELKDTMNAEMPRAGMLRYVESVESKLGSATQKAQALQTNLSGVGGSGATEGATAVSDDTPADPSQDADVIAEAAKQAQIFKIKEEGVQNEFDLMKGAADKLAGLASSKNKKLAAIGKAAVVAQKVAALAQIMTSQGVAMGKAMEAGPLAGAAQMVGVIAQFASIIASVEGVSGAAHGGLSNVPKESTYLLDKGERVLSPNQNSDLTGFLKRAGGADSTRERNPEIVNNIEPKVVIVDNEEKVFDAMGSENANDIFIAHLERNPERAREALGV